MENVLAVARVLARLKERSPTSGDRVEARRIISALWAEGFDVTADQKTTVIAKSSFDESLARMRAATDNIAAIATSMRGDPAVIRDGRAA